MKNIEWLKKEIDKNTKPILGDDNDYLDMKGVISVELLRELIYEAEKIDITKEEALEKIAINYPLTAEDIPYILEKYLSGEVKELELPEVPEFIASWIETHRHHYDDFFQVVYDYAEGELDSKVFDWVLKNKNKFAISYSLGYNVKEEKKYHVKNNRGSYMLLKSDGDVHETWCVPALGEETYELTEEEIKGFDERYWEFRNEPSQ